MRNDAPWSVIGSSALGARHVRNGAPNQDAHRWETLASGADQVVIAAVGDGHGGSRYVRSDVGSRLAVEVACRVAARAVASDLLAAGPRRIERRVREEVAPEIVAAWTADCMTHLAAQPFTAAEEARAGADLSADPLLSYGSTLLLAVLGPSQSVVVQLGDGDSLIGTADGRVVSPLPEDRRLTGTETTSLCLPDAASDFRCAAVGDLDPVLVLLATDGYGVAFADADWRSSVVTGLLERYRAHGVAHVEEMLPAWLEDSAKVGGDDATAVVAYRGGGRPAGARRRRAVPLIAAGVAGILVGAASGWLAASGGPAERLPATTTVPVASTPVPIETTVPPSEPTTTTILVPTTVSPGPAPAETTLGDVPPGGAVFGDGAAAWIAGSAGEVVEFRPSASPRPVLLDARDPGPAPGTGPRLAAVAGERWWWLEEGTLNGAGVVIELAAGAPIRLSAIDVEGGLLWVLSEGATHLLSVDPQRPAECQVFPVQIEGIETEPAEVNGDDVECTTTMEDGGSS